MKLIIGLILTSAVALAQAPDTSGAIDSVRTIVRRAGESGPALPFSGFQVETLSHGPLGHPYAIVGKHPRAGCDVTAECGDPFYYYAGYNMRTSAGTTWQSQLMGDTSTPSVNAQCTYLALTNTAITPAEADTTLSGEISSNGLARAQATYTDSSGTLSVPSAPTVTVQGTTGSTSYWYWIQACNQGICTTLSSSGTTSTANATLSNTNYDQVTYTPIQGAAAYQMLRTTSSSAPTGTVSDLVGGAPYCTSATCTWNDISNTLTSVTIPSSNLTNFGKYTMTHTWTATAAQSAQAFGAFTASSSGTMCFEGTFTQVSLNTNDTLALTETIIF